MIPYMLNGRPTAFWRGDWYVGKGIAHARIRARFPHHQQGHTGREDVDHSAAAADDDNDNNDDDDTLTIEVFNTHTHAPYSSDKSDSYRVHREAQTWHLAKLLRSAAEKRGHHLVLAAGDFNMTPLSTAYRILTAHAPVRDVWRVLHPGSSLGSWAEEEAVLKRERREAGLVEVEENDDNDIAPTAEYNIVENGVTSNSVLNTWRWPKSEQAKLGKGDPTLSSVDPAVPDPRGKRLDYIFANTAAQELGRDAGTVGGWVVKDARVTMTTRHPDLQCSLSDHFAVAATLAYHQTSKEGLAIRGIDTTSLAGQKWPLPPGRGSVFHSYHNRRKSTPALLLQGSDDDEVNTNNSNNNNMNIQEGESATAASEARGHDVHAPGGGAFLSLQSPTPSTSRLSLPGHLPPLALDYDTQLLSSLPTSPSGDISGFDTHDYDALLAGIRRYAAREADQTRWRTYHFVLWFCVTVICYIIVWTIPTHTNKLTGGQIHAINFILLLLSSLGLVAGVLDGLMALLFFRGSEKRALKEYCWELSNARAFALGETPGFTEEARVAKH